MEPSHRKHRRKKPFFILIILAGIFLLSGLVMLLWNAILPKIMPVTALSYWQALGLLVLCKILFGGFRFGPRHRGRFRHHHMREKFMTMSREERAAFRNEWRERYRK